MCGVDSEGVPEKCLHGAQMNRRCIPGIRSPVQTGFRCNVRAALALAGAVFLQIIPEGVLFILQENGII